MTPRRMREVGISFVRIAEFAWSRIEPEPGRFDWAWLDRADRHAGRRRAEGGDGHADGDAAEMAGRPPPGHPAGRRERPAARLRLAPAHQLLQPHLDRGERAASPRRWRGATAAMTAVAGWQTDNEFGCHDTVLSYGREDVAAFRTWLRAPLPDAGRAEPGLGQCVLVDGVPAASTRSIAPVGAVTETNPAARLDYLALRLGPGRGLQPDAGRDHPRAFAGPLRHPQLHGLLPGFDHCAVAEDLDFASWDSYPLGTRRRSPATTTSGRAAPAPRIPTWRRSTTTCTAPSAAAAGG